ncbi:MAG: PilZ domain-containing protein [Methylococcales bacterium]|jgi:hypothetical protein|nr:PilZ domain-containing protein [Methylococcales bacterium]MBT7410211.1 PilZ domain-containing protein [Methylococcales bacterium]
MTNPNEHREHPRYNQATLGYMLIINDDNFTGEIDNISIGGVLLRSINKSVEKNHFHQPAKLTLTSAKNRKFKVNCKLIHRSSIGIGIQFSRLTQAQKKNILELIDCNLENIEF